MQISRSLAKVRAHSWRLKWTTLLDLVTPDERALIQSQRRRAQEIAAGGLGLVLAGLVVAVVAAINNPPPPQNFVYILVILVLVLPGAGIGLASGSVMRGAYDNAKNTAMKRRPDLFDADGTLIDEDYRPHPEIAGVGSSSGGRSRKNLRADETDAPLRPCPYCGTMNQKDWSYCQKCAKLLPPPL